MRQQGEILATTVTTTGKRIVNTYVCIPLLYLMTLATTEVALFV